MKADFTVNNFEVGLYQDGEIYIQTDAPESMDNQVGINGGKVYLRIIDLKRLLAFAEATKEEGACGKAQTEENGGKETRVQR